MNSTRTGPVGGSVWVVCVGCFGCRTDLALIYTLEPFLFLGETHTPVSWCVLSRLLRSRSDASSLRRTVSFGPCALGVCVRYLRAVGATSEDRSDDRRTKKVILMSTSTFYRSSRPSTPSAQGVLPLSETGTGADHSVRGS